MTCSDAGAELACRQQLSACVGLDDRLVCGCYDAFLACLADDCNSGALGQQCLASGCTSAECNGAQPPDHLMFCNSVCVNLCHPRGVMACNCTDGAPMPTKFVCQEPAVQPTPPDGDSTLLNTGNEWIDENAVIFLVIVIAGGVCYCFVCIAIACCVWRNLGDDDDSDDAR